MIDLKKTFSFQKYNFHSSRMGMVIVLKKSKAYILFKHINCKIFIHMSCKIFSFIISLKYFDNINSL